MNWCKTCLNKNNDKCDDCIEVRSRFDGKISLPPSRYEKIPEKYIKDCYYLVKINKENIEDNLFYKTTIKNNFCGKLIQCNCKQMIFELNGSRKDLVIIPLKWIKWMAPSAILNGGENI